MAWRILGRDAVREGDKPVQFIPREKDHMQIGLKFPRELHEEMVEYCEEHHITHSAFIRYLVAREIKSSSK